ECFVWNERRTTGESTASFRKAMKSVTELQIHVSFLLMRAEECIVWNERRTTSERLSTFFARWKSLLLSQEGHKRRHYDGVVASGGFVVPYLYRG
ncbi:hypothetical protein SK128_009286, partial [Halocaridina rubra]